MNKENSDRGILDSICIVIPIERVRKEASMTKMLNITLFAVHNKLVEINIREE